MVENVQHQLAALAGVVFANVAFNQRLQLAAFVPRHRLPQATEATGPLEVGQGGDGGVDFYRGALVFGIPGRAGEPDVVQAACLAGGAGIAALLLMLVALGVSGCAGFGVGEADVSYTSLGEGEEFAGIHHAVAVGVFPDLKCVPGGIAGVDLAVAVAVKFAQRGEAVGGLLPVLELRIVAEEFSAGVDPAVAVDVADE